MTTDVVLVPGLMCDGDVWQPLVPWIEPHAACHVVDHGEADDLQEMARRLLSKAPPRFALAGHSMGGRVALEVMRQAASRVERLVLLDTGFRARPPGPAGEDERAKRQQLVDVADRCGVRAMALQWVQAMVHPDRTRDEDLIERIVAMFGRKSAETFRRQVRALLERPDASDVLVRIHVPTLVLCGRQDNWAPVSQHEAMVALLPGSGRLHVVEQAGHMCTMERPQDVGKVMQAWMLGTSA